MLELRKKRFFSTEYVAEEDGTVVAELSRAIWGDRGEMMVQGHRLTLRKHGVLKNTFTLNYGNTPVVEVMQPSSFRSRLVFRHDGREFEMRNKAWYSSTMVIRSGSSEIGTVRRRGTFSTGAVVDLPDTLPVAVRVLLGWIAMVRWDEAAAAASG